MPAFVALLMRGLMWVSGSLVGQVLTSLGIAVVTYTGANATMGWAKTNAIAALQGMGSDYVQLLSYMKVGVAINIVFSAMVARAVVNGVQSDTFKRWVKK